MMCKMRLLLQRTALGATGWTSSVLCVRHRSGHLENGERSYLSLPDMGVRDNPELARSAALIKPSPFRRNVILVQPILKKVPKNARKTTTQLQLEEATALVLTMGSRLRICETLCLSTTSENKKLFFGKGNFQQLLAAVAKHERNLGNVTVFLNTNMLNALQHYCLHKALDVDVFDRYMLVLQIFKHHAKTKEAKLQTSLAEIPYYKTRMGYHGTEDMLVQLGQREVSLVKALEDLKSHRSLLRSHRQKCQLPSVAVVGYTNAGKTSFIQKLTDNGKLVPRNQLFATLDVTCHESRLPAIGKVLYIDTVGFISDIPTQLIGSFQATLEDALLADSIVHIHDLSHPDLENQCEIVMETLEKIKTPQHLVQSMLQVGNKVDRLPHPDLVVSRAERILGSCMPISSITGQGIRKALEAIQSTLIKNTGRSRVHIRCPTGGAEYMEVHRKSDSVCEITVDESDVNFSIIKVQLTPANLGRLQALFKENSSVQFL